MVERADRAPVSTFYAPGPWAAGAQVELDEAAAHHASVKRLKVGDAVRLTSGDGRLGEGTISELARRRCALTVTHNPAHVPPPTTVELWAPIGDRDRMLLLGEKCTELGLSVWRPVWYRRSRSVTPRGEGPAFRDKLTLRMISALEQSGGAWLPVLLPDETLDVALAAEHTGARLVLDPGGEPVGSVLPPHGTPVAIALGPEGGLDPDERAAFAAAGWRSASLGRNVLRFETAAIAAIAIARALIG
jgi:16S rRNA (uracil1498-N3)-methyltransferase